MQPPEFPKEFVKNHCSKVLEARHWRNIYNAEGTDEDDCDFAECAFNPAGVGLKCESCGLFLCPINPTKAAEQHYNSICQFYQQMKKYDEWYRQEESARLDIEKNLGVGI